MKKRIKKKSKSYRCESCGTPFTGMLFTTIIIFTVLVFLIALLLVKVLWAWTIPDLFPNAVEQGLVAGSITWLTSFKIALFVAVLAAIGRIR